MAEKERPSQLPDLDLKGGATPPAQTHGQAVNAEARPAKRTARSPAELHALASTGVPVVATAAEVQAVRDFIAERPDDGSPDPDGVLKADLKHQLRRLDIRQEDR